MASQRKPKKATSQQATDFEYADEEVPTMGPAPSAFMHDYNEMHPGLKPASTTQVSGDKKAFNGASIESIVSTLAHLQFTTKGRIDENGKFELIFCSPEPTVAEVRHVPRTQRVTYTEDEGHDHKGHERKRSGHRKKPWLLT